MSVAIACTPASPTAVVSVCKISVTGATQNDASAYDAQDYPTEPELRYYLTFEKGGDTLGRSYVFGVNSDGDHDFLTYVFPSAGSWTVRLSDASDDSSVATQAVTVA